MDNQLFTDFSTKVSHIPLPQKFTFPFYYEPHPLSIIAAQELQEYLNHQAEWKHNFGLNPNESGLIIGKMFGVLVVKDKHGRIGYLSAFSGKLANSNHHPHFVPPVFDTLDENGFYKKGEQELNVLTDEIETMENNPQYLEALEMLDEEKVKVKTEIDAKREEMRVAKKIRKERRKQGEQDLNEQQLQILIEELKKESLGRQYHFKKLSETWEQRVLEKQTIVDKYQQQINTLKETRKRKSNELQQRLFRQYTFLDAYRNQKSLLDIFSKTIHLKPPAGAGECAAPKLLQYAYNHELTPLCMAEFWWGASPKSEVRKHLQYYPSCRGKCEPILGHMLNGLSVEQNPLLKQTAHITDIPVIYEDDYLLVIEKPHEFLSVPGKTIEDSVAFRMRKKFPAATGPLVVHRLDMSTSGLMLIAKSEEVYKKLQYQFIKRTIKKQYVALLQGIVKKDNGFIDLPLRVDLDNRPQQLVCYEHGKHARTEFKVIERKNGKTRIHFQPITGRTHQLRVHAAHVDGLNCPIVGDDLYGEKSNRLHLHAESLVFTHPVSKEIIELQREAKF